MSEAGQAATGSTRTSTHFDNCCDCLREGLQAMVEAITPPESACRHFREARIEVLRGIREMIDHRIDRLSRPKDTGTRVVVE